MSLVISHDPNSFGGRGRCPARRLGYFGYSGILGLMEFHFLAELFWSGVRIWFLSLNFSCSPRGIGLPLATVGFLGPHTAHKMSFNSCLLVA